LGRFADKIVWRPLSAGVSLKVKELVERHFAGSLPGCDGWNWQETDTVGSLCHGR
jgi:hypothetical protein